MHTSEITCINQLLVVQVDVAFFNIQEFEKWYNKKSDMDAGSTVS